MLHKSKIKMSSNRNFGFVFFIVFLIISLWPLQHEDQIKIWSIVISLIFLILSLMNSKLLTPLNQLWTRFGLLLGNIVAPIVMGLVFFLVVTPVGIVMRIMGKDLIGKKINKNNKSYWIKREKPIGTMKKQF